MNASVKAIAFLAVALLGLYGCARPPLSSEDRTTREKIQKLEAENQTIVAARDQYREKSEAIEKQNEAISQELAELRAAAARETSSLAEQLKSRTAERDTLQVQYDGFRKTIKELIGQAEASLPSSQEPLASTSSEGPRN